MFPDVASIVAAISALQLLQSVAGVSKNSDRSVNHANFSPGIHCSGKHYYTRGSLSNDIYQQDYGSNVGYELYNADLKTGWNISPADLPVGCQTVNSVGVTYLGGYITIIEGGWGVDNVPSGFQSQQIKWVNPTPVKTSKRWDDSATVTAWGWVDGLANTVLCKIDIETTGIFPTAELPDCYCDNVQ